MRRSLLAVIIVVLIIVGVGGYWFCRRRGFIGTIADALRSGKSLKCTWRDDGNAATIFVKDYSKYRGPVVSGGETRHYLLYGECAYSWKEGETQGNVIICLNIQEGPPETLPFEELINIGVPELGYTYSCQPMTIPDSFFNLPAEIKFFE